ncbi:DNA internalization-related competence protein ComEC/Rec2 [Fibrobacter sp.]|uniref:DNA internalization-related competence protein ComEC/Rec2 n=1 Tax=Fibrobacter sp. TaxID=35828 RepID=UPI00388F3D9F
MKSRKKQFFKSELDIVLAPLLGKPALLSSVVVMVVFVGLEFPAYALVFLPILAVLVHYGEQRFQWIVFISLAVAILCHELEGRKFEMDHLPDKACGLVESVQHKKSGVVVVVGYARLTEKRNLPQYPMPGDSICYEASWYPVNPPSVPGAFDTRAWLKSQRWAAYGKFRHWTVYGSYWVPERSFYQFRRWIRSRFADYLDPAETGLLLGLLAGERSGIPDVLRSDFQRSGLVHVLAISGFHVVLLAGMLMILLKATGISHRIVRIAAVVLLLLYVPVTGGSPAVRRAVLMFAVPQVGALFQRPANTLNSLGVALLLIVLPEPAVIWNPGFQLSVAATMGILIGGPLNPLKKLPESLLKNKWWCRLQGFILDPTYVTLCATLSTAPFLIHHFKTLSPFAWLGNIVVVPAISMGMQAGLFALLSPLDILREHFCYAARFFLRLASLLTRLLSDSPQASMTVGPFGPSVLLLCGFSLLLFPMFFRSRLARRFSLGCLLLFSALFAGGEYCRVFEPSWSISTIDVGQGDSHLITTPSGRHLLVDAGDTKREDSGKDIIVPYLHHIGVSQLDALVITHPDQDHFGGAFSIIKMIPVKELWITDCARIEPKENWQQVIAEAYRRGVVIRDIHRGFMYREPLFEIRVVHPETKHCIDPNTQSITFRAKGLGHSAVLTGDLTIQGEKEILATDAYLKSDVLKLGHHGSKTSSSRMFLTRIRPSIALISSGRKNRFRHPNKEIIRRLDSLKIPYLNTAERGTIDMIFRTDTMVVKTMIE